MCVVLLLLGVLDSAMRCDGMMVTSTWSGALI